MALKACQLFHAHRWWGRFDRWHGLVTLNYHRIGRAQDSSLDPNLFSATAEQFEVQLRYLKSNCDVIRLGDIADVLRQGSRRRAVLITFDDGYLDNYEAAFPVLKQMQLPAVIFLATGFLDHRTVAWWDEIVWLVNHTNVSAIECPAEWKIANLDLSALGREKVINCLLQYTKTLTLQERSRFLDVLGTRLRTGRAPANDSTAPWMTWDMVREMSAAGIEFGGHTVNHPILSMCKLEEQRDEIEQSKIRIEAELGETISAFSYPDGQPCSFQADTARLVHEAGYQWGFSHYSGFSTHSSDPFDLQRVAMEPRVRPPEFRSIVQIPRLFAAPRLRNNKGT